MILDDLGDVIDRLVDYDPASFDDSKSLTALNRRLSQLQSVVAAAAASFESSGGYAPDGAKTAAAWLAVRCHLLEGVARNQLRLGRAMRELPCASAAFRTGQIGAAHVQALGRLANGRSGEALRRDEALLVDQAKSLRFEEFRRALSYFEQLADPDGSDDRDEARRVRRDVSLVSSIGGMWFGHITLDPISGEIITGELDRIEKQFYERDRSEATERLGREPRSGELRRTPGQRRADALVEMASRSACTPEGAARPAPLFSVFVGWETLHGRICELASGTAISPGSLLRHLDDAVLERAVFDSPTRVSVGARRRLFDDATRRAIELRDRRCTQPYCNRPASECQVDHIVPAEAGGPTTLENGRLLCPFHNRLAYEQWKASDEQTKQAMIASQRTSTAGEPTEPGSASMTDRGPPQQQET